MKRFNIRVYGIIINDSDQVLLSHENRFDRSFTKFPGGGLEWGEGTEETLKRELLEEIGLDFEIQELIYVNEFFQQSAFNKNDQLISFYYRATIANYSRIPISKNNVENDGEEFQWHDISSLSQNDLTFPVDKRVVEELINLSITSV